MLSIVIPALNEEKYLPKLLKSIKEQTYKNYEIIVADARSSDSTRQIAKKFGCVLVKSGGLPGVGRNNGAKAAKGDMLLFLDADSLIEKDFLERSINDMQARGLDAAGSHLYPSTGKLLDRSFMFIFNSWAYMAQLCYPNACGTGIFCKKWLHEKIKGFDESIKLSEDMDYVRRCGKFGKFRLIKGTRVIYSMRRFSKEGRAKLGLKLFLSFVYRLVFGEIRSDIFKYKMDYKK